MSSLPVYVAAAPPAAMYQPAPPVVIMAAPAQPQAPVVVVPAPAPAPAQAPAPGSVVVQQPMKSKPSRMRCNLCQQEIVTVITTKNGSMTWVVFGVLFAFGIWPFCLLPFVIKSCKDVEHTCPSCKNVLHVHKRM